LQLRLICPKTISSLSTNGNVPVASGWGGVALKYLFDQLGCQISGSRFHCRLLCKALKGVVPSSLRHHATLHQTQDLQAYSLGGGASQYQGIQSSIKKKNCFCCGLESEGDVMLVPPDTFLLNQLCHGPPAQPNQYKYNSPSSAFYQCINILLGVA
jgi:hypothetical protein